MMESWELVGSYYLLLAMAEYQLGNTRPLSAWWKDQRAIVGYDGRKEKTMRNLRDVENA